MCSRRGPGGGYQLQHDPCDINVAQIMDAVDESFDVTLCDGKGNCHQGDVCLTHHLWTNLSRQLHQFLSAISLEKLMLNNEQSSAMLNDGKGNININNV